MPSSRRSGRGQGGDGDDLVIGSLFDDEDELDHSHSMTTTPPTIKMERGDTTAENSHSSSGIGAGGGDASSNRSDHYVRNFPPFVAFYYTSQRLVILVHTILFTCRFQWESVLKPTVESELRPTFGSEIRQTPF